MCFCPNEPNLVKFEQKLTILEHVSKYTKSNRHPVPLYYFYFGRAKVCSLHTSGIKLRKLDVFFHSFLVSRLKVFAYEKNYENDYISSRYYCSSNNKVFQLLPSFSNKVCVCVRSKTLP